MAVISSPKIGMLTISKIPPCRASPAQIAARPGGAEPEEEGEAEFEQDRPVGQQVDRDGVLRQGVEAEPAHLGVVEHVVQRRAVRARTPRALQDGGVEVDEADVELDQALGPGDDQGLGEGPRRRASRRASSE